MWDKDNIKKINHKKGMYCPTWLERPGTQLDLGITIYWSSWNGRRVLFLTISLRRVAFLYRVDQMGLNDPSQIQIYILESSWFLKILCLLGVQVENLQGDLRLAWLEPHDNSCGKKKLWSAAPPSHRWVYKSRGIMSLKKKGKGYGADKNQSDKF